MNVCELSPSCPGCSLWGTPYSDQILKKTQHLKNIFSDHLELNAIKTTSAGEHSLRERFDFIIKDNKIGLIDKNRNFIPIKKCLQLTQKLQLGLDLLWQKNFNIRIGTIRLRVSSHDQVKKIGLWLDFANNDIKNLLIEKDFLMKLSEDFFIEIGQKKKCLDELSFNKEQLKLADPVMQPWFYAYDYRKKSFIDINCAVSSFTQPSALTAKLLTDVIMSWLDTSHPLNIWEFGCGTGQYTFSLLSSGHKVSVFENDEFALACVKHTAKLNHLNDNLTIYSGDFQKSQNVVSSKNPDIVLVNPPKSGLKNFTENVINAHPEKIIYVSCYPESLKIDSEIFLKNNYKISKAHIVDQFPQTQHFEVVMLFERINI